MFTLSLPFAMPRNPFQTLFADEARTVRPTEDEEASRRCRREFINEMLTRSPDAFSNSYDIETAMLMSSSRF